MENNYEKYYEIEYTHVYRNLKLSVVQAMELVQNLVTGYFEMIGSDNIVIREDNAAWVVTKSKIHFEKYPKWKEKIKLSSYIVNKSKVRVEIETKAENANGDILFIAKQETCPIDLLTRKIRKIETVQFPNDIEIKLSMFEGNYEKLDIQFEEKDKCQEREIYAIDTDYTYHTNNAKYVKYIANALNSEFLDNNIITDLEIHYINESLEGQILEIYKHNEKNEIYFLIKNNEKEIIRANIKYRNMPHHVMKTV